MLVLLLWGSILRVWFEVCPFNLDFFFKVVFDLSQDLFDNLCQIFMNVPRRLVMFLNLETMPIGCILKCVFDGLKSFWARLKTYISSPSLHRLLRPHGALVVIGLSEVILPLHLHPLLLLLQLLVSLLPILDVEVLIQDMIEPLVILLDTPESFYLNFA